MTLQTRSLPTPLDRLGLALPLALRLGLALALGLALSTGTRAAEINTVQTDKSALTFVFHEMGVAVDGRFTKFFAQVSFDPAKPAAAKATIDLELVSIDAGSDEANDEVAGKAWFDAKQFPQARFVSTAVKALGGNRYELSGKISIKGRTQEISAPFTFTPKDNGGSFDGAFVLKRADFAIGEGIWADVGTVANEIQIKFHFLASAGK
jgi:polyisoprenoid-binding protein YceI